MNNLIILILYIFSNHSNMDNCFEVKNQKELYNIISENALHILHDGKRLSKYRTTSVYHLKNGQIILVPNVIYPNCKGLLLKNDSCLQELLKVDYLPVDNPEKKFLEFDREYIINVANNILYFTNYLNNITGLKYKIVNKSNYKYYYNCILKTYESGKYNPKDALALLVVAGEIIRKEKKGKWMLKKISSEFNPYYEPVVLLENDEYIDISFIVLNRLSNGLAYDDMYMKNMINSTPIAKINRSIDNMNDYIIFEQ